MPCDVHCFAQYDSEIFSQGAGETEKYGRSFYIAQTFWRFVA